MEETHASLLGNYKPTDSSSNSSSRCRIWLGTMSRYSGNSWVLIASGLTLSIKVDGSFRKQPHYHVALIVGIHQKYLRGSLSYPSQDTSSTSGSLKSLYWTLGTSCFLSSNRVMDQDHIQAILKWVNSDMTWKEETKENRSKNKKKI